MIGIFDSGVGGMTVARAIEQKLPDVPQIYLGDLAHSPYGSKSARAITEYSVANTRFLIDQGALVIVVACNSAASVATERLRQEFSVPILEVITPAVEAALAGSKTGRIGIIGTRATIKSEIYTRKISEHNQGFQVFSQASPLLVPLIEEGWINRRETKMILRHYLRPLKDQQIDTLVLGCTHYPLLKDLIAPRIGKKVSLVDSSTSMANYLQNHLEKDLKISGDKSHTPELNRYFVTDISEPSKRMADKIFNRPIDLQITDYL